MKKTHIPLIYIFLFLNILVCISCGSIFTKREETDAIQLHINLSGIIGSNSNTSRSEISSSGYKLKLLLYNAAGILLQTAEKDISTEDSTEFEMTGIAPGSKIYITVALTHNNELLYKRTSETVILHTGINTISFSASGTQVLLYDIISGLTTDHYVCYTQSYTSAGKEYALPLTGGAPSRITGCDFDAEGNLYLLYIPVSNGYSSYLDKISSDRKVTNLLVSENQIITAFAVDRTEQKIYILKEGDSAYTYYCTACDFAGSTIATGLFESGSYTEITACVSADSHILYALIRNTGEVSGFTVSKIILTLQGNEIKASYDAKSAIFSELTGAYLGSYATNDYAYISDLKYYNGCLWLLLNQSCVSLESEYAYSRGGLVAISIDCIGSDIMLGYNTDVYGWSVTPDAYNSYRRGATALNEDNPSAEGFNGPLHIISLAPRRIYIADDGVKAVSYNNGVYHLQQSNRVVCFDTVSRGYTTNATSVEFEAHETGSSVYYLFE